MKKVIFLLLFTFCCCSTIFSQSNTLAEKMAANGYSPDQHRSCSSDEKHEQMMQEANFAAWYNQLQNTVSAELQYKSQAPCATPLIVPVVIHFESGNISNQCMIDASLAQIEQLNLDFAGCNTNAGMLCEWINAGCDNFGGTAGADAMPDDGACIQFCLADQNLPAAETTIGGYAITSGDYNSNNQNASNNWQGYFNVYVGGAGGALGFVPFLGGASNTNNTEGASILTSTFGAEGFAGCEGVGTDTQFGNGATLTHEAGHWFGCEHTFSDAIVDTPPQNTPNYGCPTVNTANCTSTVGTDYGGNFMDYVDDDCMFTFTQDQVDIMVATAADQADWATNSISCMPTYPPCDDQAGACLLACPTVVTTPYDDTADHCASAGAYPLPTDFSAVVLDDDSDAIYTWSTGGYISVGGAALMGPDYAVTPSSCAPITETLYLNIGCNSDPAVMFDGGTLALTVYPDPTTFMVTDLVTFTDGTCDEPTFVITAGCEAYVMVVADANNPAFPVAAGQSGTANYDVTLDYPIECCCPLTMATQTEANTTMVPIADNTTQCTTVTIPNGGSITDVIIDVGVTHTWVGDLTITLTSPAGTSIQLASGGCSGDDVAVTFDDAATSPNGDYVNNCSTTATPAISGAYQPTDPLSTFDGEDAAGDWILCIADGAGGDTGTIDNFGITITTEEPCTDNADCVLTGTANYNCMGGGVPYCDNICFAEYNANPGAMDTPDAMLCVTPLGCADSPDASCLTTAACDDADPCTEGEMETTVTETGEVCTACGGGTPVAQCTLPSVAQACDDGDPCTENDMEEVDACDATIVCVPCAGTVVAQCTLPSVAQACDDGDPCTINDMEEVDACDATIVCVPCAGTPDPTSCDADCVTLQACDDGDPCTTGEQESVSADGGICEPCGLNAMAVTPACGDPTASNYDAAATCIDNALCTYGTYCDNICYAEYAASPGPNDMPDAMLCVTPLSCADNPDASCIGTRACDDGDPCTTGEEETYTLADGSACGDCGLNAMPVTAACGDPTAENYDPAATCIDNTLCTYAPCEDAIAGTVTLADCDFTGAMVTVYDATGAIAGTAMTDAMGNYALTGLFACGTYSAELTAAPACYIDEGGDIGPAQFAVNGDGAADGFNFAPIPANIPTVGEWGLIILGLMMSIVAIIGIRERKTNEIYS